MTTRGASRVSSRLKGDHRHSSSAGDSVRVIDQCAQGVAAAVINDVAILLGEIVEPLDRFSPDRQGLDDLNGQTIRRSRLFSPTPRVPSSTLRS